MYHIIYYVIYAVIVLRNYIVRMALRNELSYYVTFFSMTGVAKLLK